ncbi:MAG: ribosomal protein S18-alanine N-acetyltransferase [Clostridia bacterium]|nr:ribosomal protein S18-alanine N-acetyltransferase [Clostridia bacterium]
MKVVGMTSLLIPAVAALEQECFANPWSPEGIEESFNNPAYYFFVCRNDDGEPVGYISYYQVRDEAFINNVAVTESARRQGVGRALVQRAEQSARDNGAAFLSLEVRRSNDPAIELYESQDFEVEGVRRKYYRDPEEDAFLMTKRFTPEFDVGLGSCGRGIGDPFGAGCGVTIIPEESAKE